MVSIGFSLFRCGPLRAQARKYQPRLSRRADAKISVLAAALALGCNTSFTTTPDLDAEDAGTESDSAGDVQWRDGFAGFDPIDSEDDLVLVHESVRRVSPDGSSVLVASTGSVAQDVQQATARPWTHMGEEWIYNDEGWTVPLETGEIEIGFRIWRKRNTLPYVVEPTSGPPSVAPEVDQALAAAAVGSAGTSEVFVDIHMRNFPEWNLPVRGSAGAMAAEEYVALLDAREAMFARREQTLEDLSRGVQDAIVAVGGTIAGRSPSGGYISAALPVEAFAILTSRDDIRAITRADGNPELLAGVGPPHWRQGDSGWADRADRDSFIGGGYTGARANPGRHAWGRIAVAVIERWAFEDDACAFMDTANCSSSRILARYACDDANGDGNYCEFVANWNDENEAGDVQHGTHSAAAALGDYTDDQGCGRALNDPNWSGSCHSNDWEIAATGIAPEAFLLYYGKWKDNFEIPSFAASIDKAASQNADIATISLISGNSPCDPEAGDAVDLAAENAFDDGVFVIAAAGNNSGPTSACNVGSPADITKAFAVNAYDACRQAGTSCTSACQSDPYLWCLVDQSASARGGASVSLAGGGTGSLSLIDLVAPNRFYYQTDQRGTEGWVIDGSDINEAPASGTSIATPMVAGMAALVKDFFIAKGVPWINYPGALHTVMLAMGDRHYSGSPQNTGVSTTQRNSGSSDLYGVGRAKIRLLDETGTGPLGQVRTKMNETTFASNSADVSFLAWGTPMPQGTKLVKCVMLQMEDTSETMSHVFSEINLIVNVRDPIGNFCSLSGNLAATQADTSQDVKSMAAIESSTALPGKCVEVRLDKIAVPAAGITTRTFCYSAATVDDEPQ